jgi:hypothetical protein
METRKCLTGFVELLMSVSRSSVFLTFHCCITLHYITYKDSGVLHRECCLQFLHNRYCDEMLLYSSVFLLPLLWWCGDYGQYTVFPFRYIPLSATLLWRHCLAGSNETFLNLDVKCQIVLSDFKQIWIFFPGMLS